jgi:hypothetical protein
MKIIQQGLFMLAGWGMVALTLSTLGLRICPTCRKVSKRSPKECAELGALGPTHFVAWRVRTYRGDSTSRGETGKKSIERKYGTDRRDEEIESQPQITEMAEKWFFDVVYQGIHAISDPLISQSEAQERYLDLLQMGFLENFTFWINGMHVRTPKGVE